MPPAGWGMATAVNLAASSTREISGDTGKSMGAAAIAEGSMATTSNVSRANASSGFSVPFSGALGSLTKAGSSSTGDFASMAATDSTSG